MSSRTPSGATPDPGPDLAALGLDGLDTDALIRSSSFCAMVHAANQLGREVSPALSDLGITPSLFLVLGQVLAAPGSSPAELARRCGFLPQTMASILQNAEDRGLIGRHGERGRGRQTQVTITRAGVDLLLAGWPIVHAAGAGRLSEGQHRILQELLEQIRGHVVDGGDVVVLVDDQGHDCGTHPRATVHTEDTPLHRAFSTYLVAGDRLLLTRRALAKRTWPGVWTNTACGHLLPGEDPVEAATRRVPGEIGATPRDLRIVLPEFRYRAVDASGIVEHEICPVMVGEIDPAEVEPNPAEVAETAWVTWDQLRSTVEQTTFLLSPWCVSQVEQMGERPW